MDTMKDAPLALRGPLPWRQAFLRLSKEQPSNAERFGGSDGLPQERNKEDSTHVLVRLRRALRSQLVPGNICIVTATDEIIADGFGQILFRGGRLHNLESVIIIDNL